MIYRRVWVIDSETTGMNPQVDKAVEIAGILMDGPEVVKTYQTLVNPGMPIPPEASAVHHITDAMVVGAPSIDAALQPLLEEDVEYAVAHNAGFDCKFVDLGDLPWLCTWKLANIVWREAPSFGNQVLRYWLGLKDPSSNTHAHRALYDVEVTSQIFAEILKKSTHEDPYPGMLSVSQNPVLLRKVKFGEHINKQWSEVPVSYLKWMVNKSSGWDEDTLHTAKYWLERSQ